MYMKFASTIVNSLLYREDWKPVLTITSIIYGLQFLFLVSVLMNMQTIYVYDTKVKGQVVYHESCIYLKCSDLIIKQCVNYFELCIYNLR